MPHSLRFLTRALSSIAIVVVIASFLSGESAVVFVRNPVVDSTKKEQMKSTKVRMSFEISTIIDSSKSTRTVNSTASTWYDREGNAVCTVNKYPNCARCWDSTVFTHDRFGNILTAARFDSARRLAATDTHFFDMRGKRLDSRYFDKNGDMWHRLTLARDADERVVREVSWARDYTSWNHTYTYKYDLDQMGRVLRFTTDDNEIEQVQLDEQGRISRSETIVGRDTSYYQYHYSDNGLRTQIESFNASHQMSLRRVDTRDTLGRIVKATEEDFATKEKWIASSAYADTEEVSQYRSFDSTGALKSCTIARYTAKRNLIEFTVYSATGATVSHEVRKYDVRGNIISIDASTFNANLTSRARISRVLRTYTYAYYK